MDYKNEIESAYQIIVEPLENYSGKPTSTLPGMRDYFALLTIAIKDLDSTLDAIGSKAENLFPQLKEEIDELIQDAKNRLIRNYKPQ